MIDATIRRTFDPIIGQMCWGLNYEHMLNLSMSFGRPRLDVREPHPSNSKFERVRENASRRIVTPRGDWWLWLRLCHWKIRHQDKTLATGCSSLKQIHRALHQLSGQKLTGVTIDFQTGATRFEFDLAGVLECHCFRDEPAGELWCLHKPRGYFLSIHGDGTFTHGPGNRLDNPRRPIAK